MYKEDLALNNVQWFLCHKPNQTKSYIFNIYEVPSISFQTFLYTLLKLDCHGWWISKMQSGREDTLEERYAIKFCFKLGKNPRETYGMLQTASRPSCVNRTSVFEWQKRFKEGRESLRNDETCGRCKEVRTPELIGQINKGPSCVYRDNKCTVWCQCGNCTHNY